MNERMTESERATLCRRIDELCMENERLRQENRSIGMAAYEVGYKNGSVNYELEHCPACKNIADLQEALEENAKLREAVATAIKVQVVLCGNADSLYCRNECPLHRQESDDCLACDVIGVAQEFGIEVD